MNSGHMLADGMTKGSSKSPPPALDLLLHVLLTNEYRITYCEGSWRKELSNRQGATVELPLVSPERWNPPGDEDYDIHSATLKDRSTTMCDAADNHEFQN